MKKMIAKWFNGINKKGNGDGGIIVALVVITSMLIVTAFNLGVQNDFTTKTRVDGVVRAYLLVAETQGGLTPSQMTVFQTDIADILNVAPTDVVVTATTAGSVNYGASVEVGFTCNSYRTYTSRVIKNVSHGTIDKTAIVHTRKTSTSKY